MVGDTALVLDVTEFTTASLYFGKRPLRAAHDADTSDGISGAGECLRTSVRTTGISPILAAALVGEEGRVFAFEPNPPVYEQLAQHVRLNHFEQRVVLLQEALSDTAGEGARLFVSQCPDNSGLSSLTPGAESIAAGSLSEASTIRVRTDTFDRWLASGSVERVDLVKIDTEGAEAHVVRGMSRALREKRIGAVVCETQWDSEAHRLLCASGLVSSVLDSAGTLANIAYGLPR